MNTAKRKFVAEDHVITTRDVGINYTNSCQPCLLAGSGGMVVGYSMYGDLVIVDFMGKGTWSVTEDILQMFRPSQHDNKRRKQWERGQSKKSTRSATR